MVKKWNDSSKRILRPFIVRSARKAAAKAAIFMPADTCYCVQEALKQGSINLQTKLLIIDRNRATLGRAYDKLVSMGFDQDEIYMFVGNLKESAIERFENSEGKTCKSKIEFIYLDTCGELTESMFKFLSFFLSNPLICPKCTLAFTFSIANRASAAFLKTFSPFNWSLWNVDKAIQKLLKTCGFNHTMTIAREYKEKGPSIPMFTARYEHKSMNIVPLTIEEVPNRLGFVVA